jgi:arsenite oxidase small subunit
MGTHCDQLVDSGRRKFLTGASVAAVSAAASTVVAAPAKAKRAAAGVIYPSNRLGNVHDLKVNEPLNVAYPDDDSPGVLIKLGKRVPSGAGPEGDVVGFSTTCPHKGFPLAYNQSSDLELSRPLLSLRCRGGSSASVRARCRRSAAL